MDMELLCTLCHTCQPYGDTWDRTQYLQYIVYRQVDHHLVFLKLLALGFGGFSLHKFVFIREMPVS